MKNKNIKKILWADAKYGTEMLGTLVSSAFWCWIIFSFVRFFFAFTFGIYHAQYGKYPESLLMITQSETFTWILVSIIILGEWGVKNYL